MKNTKTNKHLDAFVKELSEQLTQGKPLTGQDGVFTPLLKRVIEASLEGMTFRSNLQSAICNLPRSLGTSNCAQQSAIFN